MPGGGGTQNLPRAVGERRAKELILARASRSAPSRRSSGDWSTSLRTRSRSSPMRLKPRRDIADNAPLAVRQAKKSIHYGLQTDLRTGYRFEIEAYNRLVASEDRHEGVRAFNEKRQGRVQGASDMKTISMSASARSACATACRASRPSCRPHPKLAWIAAEVAAGVREIEVCSFVPPKLMPQFADAEEVVARRAAGFPA